MLNQYEIEKEFKSIVDGACDGQPLKDYLQGVQDYGQQEFSYYYQATDLYDKYRSDCQDWLENLVSETGMKPWDIFENWDYIPGSEINKWIVISEMFEEYCITRLDKINK
jgi:hypothetical protein